MKTTVLLDKDLLQEVERTADLLKENSATVIRMAIRVGLPVVANRHQMPRPEGYFQETYNNWPKERLELEQAFGTGAAD